MNWQNQPLMVTSLLAETQRQRFALRMKKSAALGTAALGTHLNIILFTHEAR